MAQTVANLEVEIGVDSKKLKKGLTDANKSVTGFAGNLAGANLSTLGIVAGIVGIGAASVDAAVKWESAFAGVEKTVDASTEELALLEEQLRTMATDTSNPLSALDNAAVTLAKIAEMGGSLGIAIGDMDEFTQTVGMLAMTTDLTAEAASTMIAQFANITGMDADDYDNFGATLVDLGNKMAATEGQILEFAQRIAAAGENAGFSEDEILAFSAAMASVGLNPEAGGSAFTQSINEIVKAVALGGPALDTIAETAGTTAEAFQTAWADDPAQALVDFLEGLGNMTPADRLQTLEDLGLSGIRVTDTLSRLSANTELVSDALTVANTAWDENTALMTEAEKRAATTESKFEMFKNNLNELGITLGNVLLPFLSQAALSLSDFVSNLGEGNLSTGLGDNFIDMAEDIADAVTPMKDDITLPDFATVQDGWTKFFDSMGILFQNAGLRLTTELNTIAVGARTFVRDIEELLSRAQVAGADINNLLGQGSAANDAAWNFGTSNINAIESAEALEQQLRDSLLNGDISIDMSQLVTTDPAALAAKLVDPVLMQNAITTALGENDQAALTALVPIAMEMGIDVNSLWDQFYAKAQEAGALGTAEVSMAAAVTVNPASIDLSPVIAGIHAAASGVGGVLPSAAMPSLDTGGMVTADGVAMVHANERVLNPAETAAYNSGQGGGGGNTVIINGVQNVDALMYELKRQGIDLRALAA